MVSVLSSNFFSISNVGQNLLNVGFLRLFLSKWQPDNEKLISPPSITVSLNIARKMTKIYCSNEMMKLWWDVCTVLNENIFIIIYVAIVFFRSAWVLPIFKLCTQKVGQLLIKAKSFIMILWQLGKIFISYFVYMWYHNHHYSIFLLLWGR